MVVPHGAMSISSFAPAARMLGREASIATAGSFCLLRGNGVMGLPTVTLASVAAEAGAGQAAARMTPTATAQNHPRHRRETLIAPPIARHATTTAPTDS